MYFMTLTVKPSTARPGPTMSLPVKPMLSYLVVSRPCELSAQITALQRSMLNGPTKIEL